MEEAGPKLIPFINNCEMPFWIIPKIQALNINGGPIKDHGGPGLTHLENGAISFEIARQDASCATFHAVHNCLGQATIDILGDEE